MAATILKVATLAISIANVQVEHIFSLSTPTFRASYAPSSRQRPTPSFQAILTFSIQNPNKATFAAQFENDTFTPYLSITFYGDQMFNSSMNQQKFH